MASRCIINIGVTSDGMVACPSTEVQEIYRCADCYRLRTESRIPCQECGTEEHETEAYCPDHWPLPRRTEGLMEWTREPPTQPGWYRRRYLSDQRVEGTYEVRPASRGGVPVLVSLWAGKWHEVDYFHREWMGPLERPEESPT